jgi:poly(rC)-binding protein 3/4
MQNLLHLILNGFLYQCQISGATVEISDTRSGRGDRIAQISGTPEQKRAAENLIQAFIMST